MPDDLSLALRDAQQALQEGKRRVRDRERVAHFKCPHCACFAVSTIVDTRPRYGQDDIRRRHECSECGERYTTIERVIAPQIDAQTA